MNPVDLPWEQIDTVLLDLDGTLLDLHFDNHFFLAHLPKRLADIRGCSLDEARDDLTTRYRRVEGSLDWYCLSYWQQELGVDLIALKAEIGDRVGWRTHAPAFLTHLVRSGRRRVLATNAHPDTLAFKRQRVGFDTDLDDLYSAHVLGAPKEDALFWERLQAREGFTPERTLFVDDNPRVLQSARDWGMPHLLGITRPDSNQSARPLPGFVAVEDFDELAPIPGSR